MATHRGMTTRREVLSAAALASLGGLLTACQEPAAQPAQGGDRLLVAHRDGLGIFDSGTKKWLAEPKAAAAGENRLARLEGETLVVHDSATARVSGMSKLHGQWTPRATSQDQVALVAGSHGTADIYRPEPRVSTSLLVMRDGKERKRFKLEGNFEPEAFSRDGDRLFLLDYLPPKAPDVYRVRMLDLASGRIDPLSTRTKTLVPEGAEEVMRGQGRHALHDPNRGMLFTLYTHLGDHQHTGELLGVRPGAPNVHAFIHALHLQEGWAFCIDLPAPFGTGEAQGHTIAISELGNELYAISAQHGTVAVIDPEALTIKQTHNFSPAAGTAYALGLPQDRLLIGAGRQLTMLRGADSDQWPLDFDLRGLAQADRLWAGREGGVSALDPRTFKEIDRAEIPALTGLRQAFAAR
jgi:hypothetical protein